MIQVSFVLHRQPDMSKTTLCNRLVCVKVGEDEVRRIKTCASGGVIYG